MALRDWLAKKFGGTGRTLLDESVYSSKALKKDIKKLDHQHKRLEKAMNKHRRAYQDILEEGAQAPEFKREALARKANIEKKKFAIQKKKYKASSLKLAALVSIEGARDIMSMGDDLDLEIDELLQDEDRVLDMQGQLMDRMVEFGLEIEDFQQIEDELDIPIMQDEFETETTEEKKIMDQIAAKQMSAEEVDIDVEVGSDDVMDEEFDEFDTVDEGGL